MSIKPKLSVEEQVAHMQSKGIKFNIVSTEEAAEYLSKNTYFFKVKAYAKMFEKYNSGDKKGQYVNLEFAYLKELAIIDMHIRHFIIKATIDIEHTIKVLFLRDFNSSKSNGYEIVQKYFETYPDVKNKILQKKTSSYCKDLIEKLEKEGYAIWNIVEILPFGDFINLYKLFYEEFPEDRSSIDFTYPMMNIKNLRNAAAHNNCILNQLTKEKGSQFHENRKIVTFVSKIKTISRDHRRSCMGMQVVHDFVTLLYVINVAIESDGVKNKILAELKSLVYDRMPRNKQYFIKNNEIMAVYDFVKKIVDTL